jgi:hypothetical protein
MRGPHSSLVGPPHVKVAAIVGAVARHPFWLVRHAPGGARSQRPPLAAPSSQSSGAAQGPSGQEGEAAGAAAQGPIAGGLVPLAQRTGTMSQDLIRSSIEWLQQSLQQVGGVGSWGAHTGWGAEQ